MSFSCPQDKDKGSSNKTPKLDRSDGVKDMKEKAPKRKLPFTVGANGDQKDSDSGKGAGPGRAFEPGVVSSRKKGGVLFERAARSSSGCTVKRTVSGLSGSLGTHTWRHFIGNDWTQWAEEGLGKSLSVFSLIKSACSVFRELSLADGVIIW